LELILTDLLPAISVESELLAGPQWLELPLQPAWMVVLSLIGLAM
jgi:hypothetical protein